MVYNLVVPELDYEVETEHILHFVRTLVSEANANGVVVGLSGGVDSSLTVTLCVHALGKERVLGVLLPNSFTPIQDVQDAKALSAQLGIKTEYVNIEAICEQIFTDLRVDKNDPKSKMPMANIRARTRMFILYYYANLNNLLVAGTGDKSEALIGFFTKYGDGGVDFLPIVHLYKTQVRKLAEYLEVPPHVAYKPASPQLYPGHKATDEIPINYEQLDPILIGLFDKSLTPKEVSNLTGQPLEIVKKTLRCFNVSIHKRTLPPGLS
jgi:NAD+ synthase